MRVIKGASYRGLLKPIQFPWTTIKCSIDYDTEFQRGERLTVNCHEDAVSQAFEGSDLFVNAMSKLKVIVAGSAEFYIDEFSDKFSVGVSTRVSFPVPDYFPDALLKSMQKAGKTLHLSISLARL